MYIEGVLEKAIQYYTIDDSKEMKGAIVRKGRDIMERLSLNTNASLTTPMYDSIEEISMIRVFLSSSLSTIVFFLAILSI